MQKVIRPLNRQSSHRSPHSSAHLQPKLCREATTRKVCTRARSGRSHSALRWTQRSALGNPASFKRPSVLEVNACSVRKVSSVEQSSGSSEARSKIPAIILKALGLRLLFIERKRSSQRGLQYDAGVEGGGRKGGRDGWRGGGGFLYEGVGYS